MVSNPISLAENIKGEILYSVPLSQCTSFGVGGPVDYLVFPSDPEELQKTLKWCRKERVHYFFLGNGTNLLVRDGGVRGMAISLSRGFQGISELERREKDSLLQAGAGEPDGGGDQAEGLYNAAVGDGLLFGDRRGTQPDDGSGLWADRPEDSVPINREHRA